MSENQEQIEYWNGPGGKRWTRYQEALDRSIRPFGARVLEALTITAGERVLDIGCGCGDTTLGIAALTGNAGRVLGVDVSAEMLERARARANGVAHVEFLLADAAEHAFSESFDVAFSRFGVMFFADAAAAFGNLKRALRPGARLGFVCWRSMPENPWCTVPLAATKKVLVDAVSTMDAPGPGPFAFADADTVRSILASAGFLDIAIERFDRPVLFSTTGLDDGVEYALSAGPASRMLLDASEAQRASVRAAIKQALSPHCHNDVVELPGSTWIVTANS